MPVIKPSFKSHKAKWENCTRCDLCKTRKKVVFARGTIPCDVLFIGDSPGHSEDVIGKPFVGPAGKLLNAMLEDVVKTYPGVTYAMTTLLGCIPIDNTGAKNHLEISEDDVEKCLPKLREFIKLARPNGIITVGERAEYYVPLIIESMPRDFHPKQIESIHHPAFIMRSDISRRGLLIQTTTVKIGDVFEEARIPF